MEETNQFLLNAGTILSGNNCKYKIIEVLGHGTFGVTYLATKYSGRKAGEKVCIKEFFVNGISSREESGAVTYGTDALSIKRCKEEFIAEAKNLIALNHPNIVKAHDLFEANKTYYYAMDYIEGENLNSYLKHTNLSLQEATSIITRIAYGLSYMHESQHMLHLDLKPGNIMRRARDGQIILIDFGLSRFFTEEGTPEDAAKIGLGTKGYAPVEQTKFKNHRQDFTASIDVYALGATFYKLITGETPLPAEEYLAHELILEAKLRSIGLPENTIKVVTKAMNPNPKQRYQSVMFFIYDLDSDERKRRNKGYLYSIVGFLFIVFAITIFAMINRKIKTAKEDYYKSIEDYAFEIVEINQGANHYGEREYYKFFPNGMGLYLFVSWHDQSECVGDCDLSAHTDTLTFQYHVTGNTIIYPRWIEGEMSGDPKNDKISINPISKTFILDEYDNRFIDMDKVDWNKINEIIK